MDNIFQQLLPLGSLLISQQLPHILCQCTLLAAEHSQEPPDDVGTALLVLPKVQLPQLHLQCLEAALGQLHTTRVSTEVAACQGKLQQPLLGKLVPAPGCHPNPLQAPMDDRSTGWARLVQLPETLECHRGHPGEEHNSWAIPAGWDSSQKEQSWREEETKGTLATEGYLAAGAVAVARTGKQ